jgi:hypothetical protein
MKTRWRKVNICRLCSGKQFFNCIFAIFAEAGKRHSKHMHLLENSVINMISLLLHVFDWRIIMIRPGLNGFNPWTSSKISSAGSHSERWWIHWKTILCLYIRTSNIVTVQIHSRKKNKLLKGLKDHCKMDIKTGTQQDLRYLAARFNEKGCLPGVGWRCSKASSNLATVHTSCSSPPWGTTPMSSVQASLLGHACFCVGFEQSSKKLK